MAEEKHRSLWDATCTPKRYSALLGHLEVDVAIIGAGITGLTTAYLLKKAGKRVVVLEAKHVGFGTTGRTSAHLTTLWDEDYSKVNAQLGTAAASSVASLMLGAIDTIQRIIESHNIDCDFSRIPGFYYATSRTSEKQIRESFEACQRLDLPVTLHDEAPVPFKTRLAMEIKDQARFHPLKYVHALAELINEDGSFVCEQSPVIDFSDGKPCKVTTPGGHVTSECIVMATHLPIGLNPLQTEAVPYRSYVTAFTTPEPLPDALYWDTASPYYYTRTFKGETGDIVIVGGQDRKTAHGSEEESFSNLGKYVRKHYKSVDIKYEWSAQFYTPADRLPFIGRSPLQSHTFIATGFSGDGLTFGTAAAELISDLIQRNDRDEAELLSPSRINLNGLKRFIEANADVAKCFVKDRVMMPGPDKIEQLKRGEGCVVSTGLSQLAAYRDDKGNLSTYSAVCPHLKCIVRWNNAQKTFDCPCHGSRFATDGSVLEGPALKGLAAVER